MTENEREQHREAKAGVLNAWDALIRELARHALAHPGEREQTRAFYEQTQLERHHWIMGRLPDGLLPAGTNSK